MERTGSFLVEKMFEFTDCMVHKGSEMRMKNSAGEECVMKFLGSREGFHRVSRINDSASEYAPLIGSNGLKFRFCSVIGCSVGKIQGADWPLLITS